ncbi:MAG: hypothetical protein V4773_13740 [Verrucomicrobiota bacterium]
MIVALIDNGSLEPASYRNLRAVAAAISARADVQVHAVSWKHSDRIAPELLDDTPAWTLAPFVRRMVALGQRDFVFIPFFVSAQGAIGSALRRELEELQRELFSGSPATNAASFEFTFTDSLAARGVIPTIVAERIRSTITARNLRQPPVVVVDHGGPSATSAALRDGLATALRNLLEREVGPLSAASMEGVHPPLLADHLATPAFAQRDVVVAMLFLSPGRHAGPEGDVAQICRTATSAAGASGPRCHPTDLIGNHPAVADTLAAALRATLSILHVNPSA